MNTISSVYYGWAFLILCGGGSYYFAKRSIAQDRIERARLEYERRRRYQQTLQTSPRSAIAAGGGKDGTANPSREGASEVSPGAGHEVKSKWEASEPYRSPRGDRFSRISRESADKSEDA